MTGHPEREPSRVHVFELIYPGTSLQGLPEDIALQVQPLLFVMESHLADAAVGLALFEDSRARPWPRPEWDGLSGDLRRLVQRGIEVEQHWHLQAQGGPMMTPEERWKADEGARFEAERLLMSWQWKAGKIPEEYERRLPFIHGHTVLYALDGVSKSLGVLTKFRELPQAVVTASNAFAAALPSVVEIRNSAHHTEDRARMKGKYEKPLNLHPIDNDMIRSDGGALVLSALNNDRLGYTLNDGYYGEVEISEASVKKAQVAIQAVLNALEWRGPCRLVPSR